MLKLFIVIAAAFAGLAVLLGAFGAHTLKQVLSPEALNTFETGVRYHIYHSFALLVTGILYERFRNTWIRYAGSCFITGIVLFSGSLYMLALLKASGSVGIKNLGMLTPFGGLFLIAGWICVIAAVTVKSSAKN